MERQRNSPSTLRSVVMLPALYERASAAPGGRDIVPRREGGGAREEGRGRRARDGLRVRPVGTHGNASAVPAEWFVPVSRAVRWLARNSELETGPGHARLRPGAD